MKQISEILKKTPFLLLFVIIGVIAFPFILIIYPFIWIQNKKFSQKYNKYLKSLDGKNFFCYNNREKGFDFITEKILPNLPEKVEAIYLNGKKIESEKYKTKFLSKAFYSFKNYNKFPQLLKIRDGQTFDCSLNTELFNCLNQVKNKKLIHDKMKSFFDLNK